MSLTIANHNRSLFRRWLGIQSVGGLALVLVLAAGWVPTARAAGPAGVQAMVTAAGITWIISGVALLPLFFLIGSDPKPFAQAALAAGAIRFILVLMAAVPIALLRSVPVVPFLLWIAICYLAVLAADTATLVYVLSKQRD